MILDRLIPDPSISGGGGGKSSVEVPRPNFYMLSLEADRDRKRKRKADGRCTAHAQRSAVSVTRCQDCLDRDASRQKKRRDTVHITGLCPTHPKMSVLPGRKFCVRCQLNVRINDARLEPDDQQKARTAFQIFDGVCQCCGTTEPGTQGWCLDHCHRTHKFRGIICSACNTMLGMARESVTNLEAGIRYLIDYARRQAVSPSADGASKPPPPPTPYGGELDSTAERVAVLFRADVDTLKVYQTNKSQAHKAGPGH
jgi:hypothetical protein